MSVIKLALERAFREKSIRKTLETLNRVKCNKEGFSESGSIENGISIVPFIGCKINKYESPASESLSFDFSGCAMAQYKERGVTYAAHICLYGSNNEGDCRNIWNDFIERSDVTDVILFYPKTEYLQELQYKKCKEEGKPDGIVTICGYIKDGKCYSAVIDIEKKEVIQEIEHNPLIGKGKCHIGNVHGETGITPQSSSCVIL